MAPFSKRQIGYIKAVAGVGQHKSFINYKNDPPDGGWASHVNTSTTGTGASTEYADNDKYISIPQTGLAPIVTQSNFTNTKALAGALFCLNNIPLTVDHNDDITDINNQVFTQYKFQKALIPHKMMLLSHASTSEGDETLAHGSTVRVGEDFYLESTHIKWRFTMPDFSVAAGKQPHHEYRFIVFRQRKPTMQRAFGGDTTGGQWLNFNYDLFSGYEGRRVGWSGHRQHEIFDESEGYVAAPVYTTVGGQAAAAFRLTTDDIMTMPLNDADYVIMRDERFFLGSEHGKSHYETTTHFDWSDPGSCTSYNMVEGLDASKNYDWWFLILGTTNDDTSPVLNISVRGTTAVTSA